MAAWGINSVRIPLNEHCWLGLEGAPAHYTSAHYRAAIAAYVTARARPACRRSWTRCRSTGAQRPVIATGPSWGGDLSQWLAYQPRDPARQLVAGVHVFDFASCSEPDCWTMTFEPVARTVPVIATELGQRECSADFIERFMSWADSPRVSYLGWSWNPAGCDAPSLIRSWDGAPTASGARFRAHLAGSGVAARRFDAP